MRYPCGLQVAVHSAARVFSSPGYPGDIAVGIHFNGYDLYQNRSDGHLFEVSGGSFKVWGLDHLLQLSLGCRKLLLVCFVRLQVAVHSAASGVLFSRMSGRYCGCNPYKWIRFVPASMHTFSEVTGGSFEVWG